MGTSPETRLWRRVLGLVWGISLLIGTGTVAFAEGEPAPKPLALAGDPAIALQGGYLKVTEQISGIVVGAREAKALYGQGDILFVRPAPDASVKPGDRFTLYRPAREVYHPVTRAPLGRVMMILGVLEIASAPKPDVVEARILRAFDSMSIGDLLMPYQPPAEVPAQQTTSGDLTGVIADFKDQRQVTAQSGIVYIDRGERDGVALGDRFGVIRPGRRKSAMASDPDLVVAELKIIGLQPNSGTAYVLTSVDALNRGDVVRRLPPPPPPPQEPKAEVAPPEAVAKVTPPEEPAPPPRPVIKDPMDVYFDFNKWALTDKAKESLADIATYLRENPEIKLLLEGHADERGSDKDNVALGEKRAKEIQEYLEGLGIRNPMTIKSYGKERPVCTEHDEPCHTKNRRVHLIFESS